MPVHPKGGGAVDLFIAAGVATAPNFMEAFRLALHRRLETVSDDVYSELVYPYGDWSRPVAVQLREAGRDLRGGAERYRRSVGGLRTLAAVDQALADRRAADPAASRRILLIGHSAGGAAVVHAAQHLLERAEAADCLAVMIGSPKCRIPPELRDSVLYVYASGASTFGRRSVRMADWITRIGTFGGWSRGGRRWPRWRNHTYAPASAKGLPIIGGHADYFRHHAPYVNAAGQSNLDMTLEAVWVWLTRKETAGSSG